jgi:hypothetical protein
LILNKLLKNKDARIVQNAGNAVLEYATSTRDLRRIGFVFGRFVPSHDFPIANSAQVISCNVNALNSRSPDKPEDVPAKEQRCFQLPFVRRVECRAWN